MINIKYNLCIVLYLNERIDMKLQILQVKADTNKKTGEIKKVAVVLGNFANYGKIEPATVKINLTDAQFEKMLQLQGKEVDLNIVVPLPQYPLTLEE